MDSKVAVFRFDATPSLGLGHAMRCLTLADAFEAVGWRCVFAIRAETLGSVPRKEYVRERALVLESEDETEPSGIGSRFARGYDLLVVDHYGRGDVFEGASRLWARRVLAIDDLADRRHDADLLLDPTLGRTASDYRPRVPASCRLMLGPRYALLRPSFANRRGTALVRRRAPAPLRRILVSLGGTDPHDAASLVLDGFARAGLDAAVDVVVGATAPHIPRVRAKAARMKNVRVLAGVDDMAALIAEADLAIGAAGTSAWERCCLGLPSLILVLADNQRAVARALAAAGAVRLLGEAGAISADDVAAALRALAADRPALAAMAAKAVKVCDGLGAARVMVEFLPPVAARDGNSIAVRALTLGDGDVLFAWQRDPATRRFARNPTPPSRAEHEAWLEQAVEGNDRLPLMVLLDGTPAGMLRLDRKPDTDAFEISILTAPDLYRRGVAAGALKLARAVLPAAELHAEVLPGNDASHALFRAAGYRMGGEGYYISRP